MTNRREFIHYSAAAATALSVPSNVLAENHEQMRRRKLPGTDESLAVVGLGNARPFAEGNLEVSRSLIGLLMARGGGYVDTSGRSRFTIGQIMAEQDAHEQLFLGTYIQAEDLESMRDEIRAVQDGQGGGELDLVITRSPSDMLARRDQFRKLREEGLTRHIGIGRHNKRFYPDIMKLMDEGIVDLIQINYSMMEADAEEEILPLAMEKNIAVVINRPFINGDYFGMVRDQKLPEWAVEFDCDTWAKFSLKFIIAHPAVSCVITETSNPKHATDNLGAGIGRLPDDATRKRMRGVIAGLM